MENKEILDKAKQIFLNKLNLRGPSVENPRVRGDVVEAGNYSLIFGDSASRAEQIGCCKEGQHFVCAGKDWYLTVTNLWFYLDR